MFLLHIGFDYGGEYSNKVCGKWFEQLNRRTRLKLLFE